MIRSLSLSAALLSLVLLISAGSASARSGGTYVPNPGSATQIKAVASAFNPTQVLAIWASPIYTGGDGGNEGGNDNGNNNGNDNNGNGNGGGDDKKDPPIPEPSTILSFGAALLIGGGVLYSRRLRRNRK